MSAIALPDVSSTRSHHAPFAPAAPGSGEERQQFAELQQRLVPLYRRVFPDRSAPQTVVVVPSLSLDRHELTKLAGAMHYEERMLCMLMLLRLPRANLVYVTSEPIPDAIVDYYLHLLPGVPVSHARRRLTLLSCGDSSTAPLTEKILAHQGVIDRIRAAVPDPWSAHISCFNATALERTLAVRLGVPLYACDPDLNDLGSKSGSREVFRRAGVALPDGFERLRDENDIIEALAALKQRNPAVRRAVIKVEVGFSGDGNATFDYEGAPSGTRGASNGLASWIRDVLPERVMCEANDESWESFRQKYTETGGIVECFVDGTDVRSPSVQCRVDPLGQLRIISTHDQILGGPTGQVYLGCTFPADDEYCATIQDAASRISSVLASDGVLGRFGIDFLCIRHGRSWEALALEINLRKGGTTHPYLMLQFLTDGTYDSDTGQYHTPTGRTCSYRASDNIGGEAYRGLTPDDLIDIAVTHGLHYNAATQEGVMFHLIGALRKYGKLGTLCVGESRETAERYYQRTLTALNDAVRAA